MPADDLRAIFDEDPQLYDRARPGYPAALFDDLAELAGIGPGARVVEVGPGTGQATAGLVARGAHVVGVELGPGLAAVLGHRFAGAAVDVVVSAFEDWSPATEPFDTLAAFTAWHWLDPAVRSARAAALLRPGGSLATVTTTHVLGGSEEFFEEVQRCYEHWDPSTPPHLRLLSADAVPPAVDEVDGSSLFQPAVRRRHQQDVTYSTRAYLDVLATYSGHRALTPAQREGLFACIADLIDHRHAGAITKRYMYELRVARRRVTANVTSALASQL